MNEYKHDYGRGRTSRRLFTTLSIPSAPTRGVATNQGRGDRRNRSLLFTWDSASLHKKLIQEERKCCYQGLSGYILSVKWTLLFSLSGTFGSSLAQ